MSISADVIRSRLRTLGEQHGVGVQALLPLWAGERFLHRLYASSHAARFVLKGGHLLAMWQSELVRSTADLDLHSLTSLDGPALRRILAEVAEVDLLDSTEFDTGSLSTQAAFGGRPKGVRTSIPLQTGSARLRLSIDVTFDQPIVPGPELRWHHGLLAVTPPVRVACCPKETMMAEKLAIAVEFGEDNTRIRDYFDLWFLIGHYQFAGQTMQHAVEQTFASRTADSFLLREDGYWARGLIPSFATPTREQVWKEFGKNHVPRRHLPTFDEVLEHISCFAIPLLRSVRNSFTIGNWTPGKGWRNPGVRREQVGVQTA